MFIPENKSSASCRGSRSLGALSTARCWLLGITLVLGLLAIITIAGFGCSGDSSSSPSKPDEPEGVLYRVPGDFPTIAAACDTASVNDTVLVACGTYHEHGIIVAAGTTLLSESGVAGCVTIDADSSGRCIRVMGGDHETVIKGFSITGGVAELEGEYPGNAGAGILCINGTNLSLINCSVSKNLAQFGCGVYWRDDTYTKRFLARDCSFHDNGLYYCSQGGNVYVYGQIELRHCTFSGGSATDGGGLYGECVAATLKECRFFDNDCRYRGGGAYLVGGQIEIDSCEWENNGGGWVVIGGGGAGLWSGGQLDISHSSFIGNSGYGRGGAVRADLVTAEYCVFQDNSISRTHSSLPAYGGGLFAGCVIARNCSFVENSASSGLGGAVYCAGSYSSVDTLIINRSLIAGCPMGTSVYCAEDVPILVSCSDIWGNTDGDWTGRIESKLGSEGNFSSNPQLLSGTAVPGPQSPLLPQNNSCQVLIGAVAPH